MEKIAIYYRVSTKQQDLHMQRGEVYKWLKENVKGELPEVTGFYDYAKSGKNTNRSEYQRMLAACKAGEFDTILVYRLDRFSRSANDAIRAILDLDDHGVAFISVTQPVLNLGHDNPFRRTMLCAFAEISQLERETIVARVKAGLDSAKKRGIKLGAPAKANKYKTKILALREQGVAMSKIAAQLNISAGLVHKVIKTSL